jgi:hypothetical protein
VELDGEDSCSRRGECLRETTGSGADLEDHFTRVDVRGGNDLVRQTCASEEMTAVRPGPLRA